MSTSFSFFEEVLDFETVCCDELAATESALKAFLTDRRLGCSPSVISVKIARIYQYTQAENIQSHVDLRSHFWCHPDSLTVQHLRAILFSKSRTIRPL